MSTNVEIITTKDGSHTLFSPHFNEIYHSRHGAIAESSHVFILNGLQQVATTPIHLFEVGFGTGLNALLAWEFAMQNKIETAYHGIELYPISNETAQALNYPQALNNNQETTTVFAQMHACEWEKQHTISNYFSFKKEQGSIQEANLPKHYFDIVFFDAFAPAAQQELWHLTIFSKLYDTLKNNGILVTYCSKGIVRRTMLQAGFEVEKTPGPPGKREMLRAVKKQR